MECLGYEYNGPKPQWSEGLHPADYNDYKAVWESIDFSDFENIFVDLCDFEEESFEEEEAQRKITTALDGLGFSYRNMPPRDDELGRESWYTSLRLARQSVDTAKIWWDALKPMTNNNLKSTQLVFNLTVRSPSSEGEWVDCTLYEQIEVDDYREYPGEKLCGLIWLGYLLVDTAISTSPYQSPIAYYVHDAEIDEENVFRIEEKVYEPDWDSMPGGRKYY